MDLQGQYAKGKENGTHISLSLSTEATVSCLKLKNEI
jgi:hypothetical protein